MSTYTASRVAGLKPFQKGQSGNPSGRSKKVKTIAQLAEENSEKALKKLIQLIDSDKDQIALAAAQAVLDRSMGKPKQTVESKTDVTHHGSEPLSDTARWIEDTLRARADRQATEPRPN